MKRTSKLFSIVVAMMAGLAAPLAFAQLGSADKNLTYTPIAPCRILDTRLPAPGGPLVANTARSFDVTAVSDYSFQGGSASNCEGLGAAGSFAAVAVNFTVINPNASGTLKAYAFLATTPTDAVTMTYAAGEVRTNFAIVKIDQGISGSELTLLSTATAHVTADVVGYFSNPPNAPVLQCEELSSGSVNVNAGSSGNATSPACSAGYTIMSGSCTMSTFDGRIVTTRTFPTNNTHFCSFRNEGASANSGVAYGRCCRVNFQ
jgi:hypothetical protein